MSGDVQIQEKTASGSSRALIVLLITVILIVALGFVISKDLPRFSNFIVNNGWLGLVFAVILYGVLGASPIPSEPLTVLIMTLYGPLVSTIVATIGNVIAAMIEFFIGSKIRDVVSFEKRRASLPFRLGRFPVDSVPFLLFARMIPGYGSKFISVIGGMYHVSRWRYFWTAVVANLVGAAVFSYGGFGLWTLIKQAIFH